MLKIGLTGGIGCGKSSVCQCFAEFGVPVVDADIIARQLVEPQQPALNLLVATFGQQILDATGALNRPLLRQMVFTEPELKRQLDDIMHPLIFNALSTQVAQLQTAYCILAIPLLLESRQIYDVDRVLVVDCSEALQIQRVMQRDHVTAADARAIMATQVERTQRLQVAHDVIQNDGSLSQLAEQVKNLHNFYLFSAQARKPTA